MSTEIGARRARTTAQLLRLVWPFALVILLQALLAGGSLYVMSAVRAYVGGESLWSKGLKDAIHHLDLYAQSQDPKHFQQYRQAIAVPLGDHVFRVELSRDEPDLVAANAGILQGKNHPDDVEAMIWLFRNFRDFSYLQRAIAQWTLADRYIFELTALADEMHASITRSQVSAGQRADWQARVEQINNGATPAAEAFSSILGEASRVVLRLLTLLNLLTAALLIGLAVLRTRKLLIEREYADYALEREKQRAQVTLAAIGDAVISLDPRGHIAYMNPTAEQLIGCRIGEAQGQPFDALFSIVDEQPGEGDEPFVQAILAGSSQSVCDHTKLILRPDGSSVAVNLVGTPILTDGQVSGAVMVLHDMTRERQFVASLSWQASHDALTGLVNRREFEYRLAQLLERLQHEHRRHALMFLDLDQFKLVNDTSGHAAGDELLRQVCSELQQHLREGDTLARLGGDEFGILLENCPAEASERIAEALRKAVQDLRFIWNGRPFAISVSIGLVQISEGPSSLESLLRTADMACYSAKEKGRNRVHAYQPDDSELSLRVGEMSWVQRIHTALQEDRFCLYAQKIIALRDEVESVHVEILLRLQDENGQIIGPGSFIPAAERYGLMHLIDRWVLRNTLQALAEQLASGALQDSATCAVNLSGASIGDSAFLDFIREQFASQPVPPQMICFEITETTAITNLAEATRFIGELQGLGCRFSLDDFCAGMSSFMYLKHLPVDYLKIDGSFVRDMLEDPIDRAMVEVINHIGHVMGKLTIAEFVESEEILQALREIGVDYAQGYVIARPQPFALSSLAEAPQGEWLATANQST
ncbi:EAL domain-containing protein [Aquipseudomonas campi]|uniref:EAL domain-containing protein n=1 Tax=Aquipseudomonas campi TaxID=2731681 RepID=A0A6M8FF08_9GAMM|nr:EAL domain-containing protein [Pseudomonas campi]QKE62770.1 EAL domain-containing protein [Pseudomonas campi]